MRNAIKRLFIFVIVCVALIGGTGTTAEAKSKVKLNTKSITMEVGSSKKLTLKKAKAKKVKWSTSNKKIAKVVKGKVTAKASGSCKIVAKYQGKKYTCKVTVKAKGKEVEEQEKEETTEQVTTETEKRTIKKKVPKYNLVEDKEIQYFANDFTKIEEVLSEIDTWISSSYTDLSDLEYLSAAMYWIRCHAYEDFHCTSWYLLGYMMEQKGYKSCYLSCAVYEEPTAECPLGRFINDWDNFYPITSCDKHKIGHEMGLVFLDSEHFVRVEVQGDGRFKSGESDLSIPWDRKKQVALVQSVHDKVEWLRDYDTVYDMIKGEYGCEISELKPSNDYTAHEVVVSSHVEVEWVEIEVEVEKPKRKAQ